MTAAQVYLAFYSGSVQNFGFEQESWPGQQYFVGSQEQY